MAEVEMAVEKKPVDDGQAAEESKQEPISEEPVL